MYRIIGLVIFLTCCQSKVEQNNRLNEINSLPLDRMENRPAGDEPPLLPVDSGWVDVSQIDSSFAIDIRYAGTDNFVGEQLYPCARCLLRPEVALSLIRVQHRLREEGLGLKFFDCYRPRSIQYDLWNKMPDARFVTPPHKGSMHNRGAAVDLTIIDKMGNELDMGSPYDFFGQQSYHTFMDLPQKVLANRQRLKSLMEAEGFSSIRTEWWHYSYREKSYDLSDYHWVCPPGSSDWLSSE